MSLPPTTTKVSSDSNNVVTFNILFPHFTGTHTGVSMSLGVNSVQGGGTGVSSCTTGDILYGSAANTLSTLGIGTTGQLLAVSAGGIPTWANNGSVLAPTFQIFLSGSGTYTTPTSPKPLYIRVKMAGGGGGGGGYQSGTGGNGNSTTFGTSLLTCTGGTGGTAEGNATAGGTATVNSPAVSILALSGGSGQGGSQDGNSTNLISGGSGGANALGGAGGGGYNTGAIGGAANTGAGGGGSGSQASSGDNGSGGGAGAYLEAIISKSNLSTTYSYSVGSGGAGGVGTYTGGAGAAGIIIVEEYYQ